MIFCGIDPGISGAIGFIDEHCSFIAVVDMPILPMTTDRYTRTAHTSKAPLLFFQATPLQQSLQPSQQPCAG